MQARLPQGEAVEMHIQVDPARQGLFLLDSQFGFGDEVRTEANIGVENKSNSSKVCLMCPLQHYF